MARQAGSSRGKNASKASSRPTGADTPSAAPELSDLDRALIDRLRHDGREDNRALARQLGVNEVTVAARLKRLEEADLMRVVAITDIQLFGHREFAFAMFRVTGRSIHDVAADVAKLPETIAVTITAGAFDVIVPVLCRDRQHASEMFGTILPSIDGVDRVHGSMALDVVKFDSNWALLRADPGTTPEAQPSGTVDEMDLDIIRILQRNARRSNRSIASELGISEGTVRGRIKRMVADRVFRIQAVSDVVAFGYGAHVFITITTDSGMVDEVAAAIAKREDISQLTRVLDDFDLIAVMIGRDHDSLMAAVFGEIALLPGIRRTEILYGCGSLKHTYAWTWIV
ncbi:MAG: Lrp/AsnC family transcriptional regulator [Mycobacterium sp.]